MDPLSLLLQSVIAAFIVRIAVQFFRKKLKNFAISDALKSRLLYISAWIITVLMVFVYGKIFMHMGWLEVIAIMLTSGAFSNSAHSFIANVLQDKK